MLKKSMLVCVLLNVFIFQGFAQEIDWNITGAGARATAMGQAFIGLADDATAISWNPAGLTILERLEFSAVGAYKMNYEDYDDDAFIDNDMNHFIFSFGSSAIPFRIGENKLVIAAAFQQQLDYFYEREFQADDSYVKTSEGSVNTISLGIAYQIHPTFSLGLTTNYWLGNPSGSMEYFDLDLDFPDYASEYTGLNFAIGTMFDFNGLTNPIPFKIGAIVKTPFELSDNYSYYYDYQYDGTYSSLEVDKTVEMPLMWGVGVSGRIGDNLTISADFEMRMYADKETIFEVDGEEFEDELSNSGENLSQFRVGAEYLLVSDIIIMPFRAGFQTVPTVFAEIDGYDTEGNVLFGDQVAGFGISFGTGLIFDNIVFDVTYELKTYDIYMNLEYYELDEVIQTTTNKTISMSSIFYIDI